MSKVSHVTVGFVVYQYTYVMNNPLKFTDPSGYMTDPSGSKFSTYGDAMWNKGGNFYYRGWYYAKNPQGYTIWGNSLISGPVGFAAGETYRSSNASHAWKYDYANDTYRNTLTGELYDPKNSFDFNSFWRQSSFETWKFSGAYFFYESEGATHLFIDGTLNRIEGTVTNNPSEAGNNSHIAANRGGDGHSRSILREMIQTTFLPMLITDGTAHSVNNLSSVVKRVTKRTSRTLSLIQFGVDFAYLSKNGFTWGENAYLGVSGLSMFMTWSKNPYILVPGIAGTFANEFGAFDSWYDDWNEAETDYKNGGVSILPVSYPFGPTSVPIIVVNKNLFNY